MEEYNNLSKQKVCLWASSGNLLIIIGLIIATIRFWQLGTDDLQDSTKNITLGFGVTMIFFSVLSILAFYSFLKNNKLSKIYFMLIAVFGFPFAYGYGQNGFFAMILLIIILFLNIGCYRKMHPEK